MAAAHLVHLSIFSILVLLASLLAVRPVQAASIALSPSSLPLSQACAAYSQQFTASGGSGSYTYSIGSGALPPGMSLSSSGLLTGAPTEAKGTYYFSIQVQDSLGSTANWSYGLNVSAPTITMSPDALPKARVGQPYSVQLSASGGCGGYTYRFVQGIVVDGITVSSGGLISGTITNGLYAGAFGIEVKDSAGFTAYKSYFFNTLPPLPVAADRSVTTRFNTAVNIPIVGDEHSNIWFQDYEVQRGPAHGSVARAGPMVTYTPVRGFSGTDSFTYVIKDAGGTSQPATVTITVSDRSDPSKDAEVLGILQAQADSARRLAVGQINNFQRRLEALHTGTAGSFSNGISFSSASARQNRDPLAGLRGRDDDWSRRFLVQPDEPSPGQGQRAASAGDAPGTWSVWTGGAVNFGKTQPGTSDNGIDFTTSGISLGADRAFGDQFALGAGIGYGHDASDVGKHDSRSTVDAYSAAVYGSYRPVPLVYVDALIGYQKMSFDSRRYVTDNGNTVTGSRDGKQLFASISVGYEHRTHDGMLISPYGRFDFARATLDSYTEHGDDTYALHYDRQTVKTSTGVLGLRAQWMAKRDYGVWMPQLRVEFRHDFQGASVAAMRYADLLGGPLYQAVLGSTSRNHTLVGAGVMLQTLKGLSVRFEYQNLLDNATKDNQSIQLGVEKKFDP